MSFYNFAGHITVRLQIEPRQYSLTAGFHVVTAITTEKPWLERSFSYDRYQFDRLHKLYLSYHFFLFSTRHHFSDCLKPE